jgi:hypothetical protein
MSPPLVLIYCTRTPYRHHTHSYDDSAIHEYVPPLTPLDEKYRTSAVECTDAHDPDSPDRKGWVAHIAKIIAVAGRHRCHAGDGDVAAMIGGALSRYLELQSGITLTYSGKSR